MNSVSYQKERKRLQEERDVSLRFLSCNELTHFVGWDYNASGKTMPADVEDGEDTYHCEIKLYQEDAETNVGFRLITARLKRGEVVKWDAAGVPESMEDYYKRRVKVVYHILYPDGLTLDDMAK